MLEKSTIQFLEALKNNNNKPWFDAHRKEYEAARDNFSAFVNELIVSFAKHEPAVAHLTAKDCLFRINRDVRFSKNKEPYKINFAAYINPKGKKATDAGYYFHLQPGNSFMGGGLWQPLPADLARIRQEIDYNLQEFEGIFKNKSFQQTFGALSEEEGFKLMRVPKGYEADNPAAEYLKFKSFIGTTAVADELLTSKNLVQHITKAFVTLHPMIQFLNKGIDA